jgi:hypothetical protein
MNPNRNRRLSRLEAQSHANAEPPPFIVVRFVKPDGQCGGEPCDTVRAEADGRVWDRGPGETKAQFEQRVIADIPERTGLLIFFPSE